MLYLYLRHRVADYARWKEAFDTHLAARQAGGARDEAVILRNTEDPQEIIVVMGWRDLKSARLFIQSVSWQVALRKMGVDGIPEVLYLESVR